MSILQDCYAIYDKEYAKITARRVLKDGVARELSRNLAFLRAGLAAGLAGAKIAAGLETQRYDAASAQGLNLDSLRKAALAPATYGPIKEFEKYRGWPTAKLVHNAYERIVTLQKLAAGDPTLDLTGRLKYLFKYLLLTLAHIEGKTLVD